jgi:hypothetical protein
MLASSVCRAGCRSGRGPLGAVLHHDLELHLGDEIHHVRRSAVDLFLTPRATEAFDLGHGHPLHSDLRERVLHFVELERLDDGFNLLHGAIARHGGFAPTERAS